MYNLLNMLIDYYLYHVRLKVWLQFSNRNDQCEHQLLDQAISCLCVL